MGGEAYVPPHWQVPRPRPSLPFHSAEATANILPTARDYGRATLVPAHSALGRPPGRVLTVSGG